jgi:glutamate---cysteine ligase / carboxylate-amine ligase
MSDHLRCAPTFGIEEEFFLVDLASRDIAALPPAGCIEALRQAFGGRLAEEMFRSQIELVTPVLHDLATARSCLIDGRQRLAKIAEQFGLGLYGAATHPFADWRQQLATDSPHYSQLFADYRDVAQRSLLSGLHVHVGVPAEVDRVRVMNRVLPWLPLLLTLSTSSPFWQGRRAGLLSYRRALCGEWPRMGIPEALPDEASLQAYVDLLLASDSIRKRGDVWWFIRPSARFPTLELRIADACPLVADVLCIAGLFRGLVAWAIEAGDPPDMSLQRLVLEENYWRARRLGGAAQFLDVDGRSALPAMDWLERLRERIEPWVEAFGDGEVFEQARRILRHGSSAERQLARYESERESGLDQRQALAAVVDMVLEETRARPRADEPGAA